MCEIYSKFTKKTSEGHHSCFSGVFIVNFENILYLFLVCLLLTLNKEMFTWIEGEIHAQIFTLDIIIMINFKPTTYY